MASMNHPGVFILAALLTLAGCAKGVDETPLHDPATQYEHAHTHTHGPGIHHDHQHPDGGQYTHSHAHEHQPHSVE